MIRDNKICKIKKEENTYIINVDGVYIYRAYAENVEYITKDIDKVKLFTATIPYSLEMIRLDDVFPNEVYVDSDKKQYTKAIINLTFKKDYTVFKDEINKDTGEVKKVKKKIASKKEIRRFLYVNGFTLDGVKYRFYKRGAAKARTGSALFIKEELYDVLMNRSRLLHKGEGGLPIEEGEECDITSLNAYQSLVLSGLEDIIQIPKSGIFIVDDLESKPFKSISSVTYQKNGKLITENKEVERVNNMTDGEGLIDESIFKMANREHKGMMLLRNDFFKCCGLNTKIQEFFKYKFGAEYETKILKDMFGREHFAKDIKIILTPSSVKYLKFAYKFNNKKECYEDWLNNIDDIFGIVKSDKEGNYGTYNRLTYQLINSMPLNKDDINEIVKEEFKYVTKLKNDLAYFMNHINLNDEYISKLDEDIEKEELGDEVNDNKYKTSELINGILAVNSDFQYTQLFKDWRKEQIRAYIKGLRKGKIRIKDTLYGTIFANVYEFLLHSIGEFNGECLGKGREIWCPYYEDNVMLAAFRNPHINAGNVLSVCNKYHNEYKWFNLTNNIILLNVSDNDFPDRGQGFDYDSDTLLLTNNPIIVKKAKECTKFPTPLNMVKGDSKIRHNNMIELAELDYVLSNNYIGKIINKSQIINSYMWDYYKKEVDDELVFKLYQISSQLSSLSQIELDKAKKSFDNISMSKELRRINHIEHNGKTIIKFDESNKMIVPRFFGYVADDNTFRLPISFETPMDYLQEILDDLSRPARTKRLEVKDLLIKAKDIKDTSQNNTKQHNEIYKIINDCSKKINSCMLSSCTLNDKGKNTVIRKAKDKAIKELSSMVINTRTIYAIVNKCFKEKEWSKNAMLTLNLLYSVEPLKVLSIFKKKEKFNGLVKDENGDINIFGDRYKII